MIDRRTYAREYARKRRRQRWAERAAAAEKCPANLGRGRPCRWPLESRVVAGHTVPFCAQCDRKARGVCIDCKAAPVNGTARKALRCRACAKLERFAAQARYRKRHPGRVRAKWRARLKRLMADPEAHAKRIAAGKLWRLANPKKKAAYAKAWNQSATARAYHAEYRAKWSAERRERERERARLRKQGVVLSHPCVACGASITGRPKKCEACARAAYVHARHALTGMAA